MDVEILLHGVPSGQDYYGVKEEQKLAESFYTNSNESVKEEWEYSLCILHLFAIQKYRWCRRTFWFIYRNNFAS